MPAGREGVPQESRVAAECLTSGSLLAYGIIETAMQFV